MLRNGPLITTSLHTYGMVVNGFHSLWSWHLEGNSEGRIVEMEMRLKLDKRANYSCQAEHFVYIWRAVRLVSRQSIKPLKTN